MTFVVCRWESFGIYVYFVICIIELHKNYTGLLCVEVCSNGPLRLTGYSRFINQSIFGVLKEAWVVWLNW